jgi:hypothetical protein
MAETSVAKWLMKHEQPTPGKPSNLNSLTAAVAPRQPPAHMSVQQPCLLPAQHTTADQTPAWPLLTHAQPPAAAAAQGTTRQQLRFAVKLRRTLLLLLLLFFGRRIRRLH